MSLLDILSGIERRFRARAIPVARAVAAPPAGFALLWVDQLSGKLKLKRADGTTTTLGAGGAGGTGDMLAANNLSDVASVPSSVANLHLTHAVLGVEVLELVPGRIGTAIANYRPIGLPSEQGYARAPTARVRRGLRAHARSSPAASTDGSLIGGYATEAANGYLRANSTSVWTTYHWFATGAGTSFRLGVYMGNANATDVDKVANNGLGIRVRPATSANFYAYSTDNAGATTTSDLGVAPAASTNYIVEIRWDGTSAKMRIASVDDTTGAIGTWSTQATISANLPANTLDLSGAAYAWCHGTPGTQPVVDFGGYRIFPFLA